MALAATVATGAQAQTEPPAQATGEPGDAAQRALAPFREGERFALQGDWQQALDRFEQSMALQPSPGTEANIARCRAALGERVTAWHTYKSAERRANGVADPARRSSYLDVIKEGLADLERELAFFRIDLLEQPATPSMTLNGSPLPATATVELLPAEPGESTFVAEAPGYEPTKRSVRLDKGTRTVIALALVPKKGAAPPATGSYAAGTGSLGSTPTPSMASDLSRTVGTALLGGGVVGLALAGGFGIATMLKVTELTDYRAASCTGLQCAKDGDPAARGLFGEAQAFQAAGLVSLGIGLGCASAGAVVLFASRSSSVAPAPSRVVVMQPRLAGLLIEGRW